MAFYASYPRKEKRPAALRAWLSQGCEPIAETVMIGLERWQPEFARRKAKDPSTVPHPATWLNGWQWEDEPPAAVTPISALPPWKQAERDEEARKRREASEEAKAMSEMKRALGR